METNLSKQEQSNPSALAKFKGLLSQDAIRKQFEETLGKKAPMFISNLVTIASGSAELQKCEHMSIISSALMAASMDLPLSPGLGFAGIVPYWDSQSGIMKAQFQVMKKGFIQLAQRTGLFKTINVTMVYEGEIKSHNRFTGDYEFDEKGKISDKIVGYVSYFRLVNGFEKFYYMPIEELDKHASKYSKSAQKGKGKWADKEQGGYEQMCEKTVLKLNLSTYAPLSVDINMMNAVIYDQAEIRDVEGKDYNYLDNDGEQPDQKEVFEKPNGATITTSNRDAKRSSEITQKATDKIDKINKSVIPPVEPPSTGTINFENANMPVNKGFDEGSVEDANVVEDQEGYSLEFLTSANTESLMNIINTSPNMVKAITNRPGKNTNKKLRDIILDYQNGTLESNVQKVDSPIDNSQEKEPELNPESNKFGIEVTELPEEGQRAFEEAQNIYDEVGNVAGIDNKRFVMLVEERFPNLRQYPDREQFCFRATKREINSLLNSI